RHISRGPRQAERAERALEPREVALEERDAPLAHPHGLDEAVARRLHPANIQGPARGRQSCLMPSHCTFCDRLKPRHTCCDRSDRDTATYGFALRSCAT